MKRFFAVAILVLTAALSFAGGTSLAQSKADKKPTRKPLGKKTQAAAAKPVETSAARPAEGEDEDAETKTPVKKNERPETPPAEEAPRAVEPQKKNQSPRAQKAAAAAAGTNGDLQDAKNLFTYEFTQPDFVVSRIFIEHDEAGKGTITFEKRNSETPITDPIQLSPAALDKIKNLYQTLNFLDSTEDYQSAVRQYAHLGTMKFRRKLGDRDRTAQFNWTENATAKALADEYRRIGNQFVWIFDINLSLENQPLEAPGLMDTLDSLLRRGEISEPAQMLPLLKKLSNDERIPLIARNHATRIVKEIEKKAKDGK